VLDGVLDCPKAKSLVGNAAAAVAAAAVVMNWRRVTDKRKLINLTLFRRLSSIRQRHDSTVGRLGMHAS
jgi:hypothetical protein